MSKEVTQTFRLKSYSRIVPACAVDSQDITDKNRFDCDYDCSLNHRHS